MSPADRTYTYIAKTLDAPETDLAGFISDMTRDALPVWRELRDAGLLTSVQSLMKVGDVDLQTAGRAVRDWQYFVLLELTAQTPADVILQTERDSGLEAALKANPRVHYLSNEVLQRPEGAGTAIPVPATPFAGPPANQLAAIEYIEIPTSHWKEYHEFMRTVMGPVGAHMVRNGNSHLVQILECTRVVHHDASLPAWNRIHILWGEFEDPHIGFFRHTTQAVRRVIGPEHDVQSALDPANRYRIKPRMSKNLRIEALCL